PPARCPRPRGAARARSSTRPFLPLPPPPRTTRTWLSPARVAASSRSSRSHWPPRPYSPDPRSLLDIHHPPAPAERKDGQSHWQRHAQPAASGPIGDVTARDEWSDQTATLRAGVLNGGVTASTEIGAHTPSRAS